VLWFAGLGLLLAARRLPYEAAIGTGLVLLTAFVNGAAWDFWGGGTLGARRMTCVIPVLMLGAAALTAIVRDLAGRRRDLLGWICAAVLFFPILAFSQWQMSATVKNPGMSSGQPDRDVTYYVNHFLRDMHRRFGNPFTYPRSFWVWLRHGVPLERYSRVTSDFPLDLPPPWLGKGYPTRRLSRLDLLSHRWTKIVGSDAGQVKLGGRHCTWRARKKCISLLLNLRIRVDYRLQVELLGMRNMGRAPVPVPSGSLRAELNGHRVLRRPWREVRPERPHPRAPRLVTRWIPIDLPKRHARAGLNHFRLCGPPRQVALRVVKLAYRRP
jgi:hypothetical protein